MVEKNSGGTTLNQATYTYDALDRRIGIQDNSGGTSTTTWTVFDGQEPYADFSGSTTSTVTERYLAAPGTLGAPLARTDSGGNSAWYLTDHLGSVHDVANTSGSIIDHLGYDSYGNIVAETSPSSGDRFKYAGMQWDATIGQYLAEHRPYNPLTGRFDSQDPLGFLGLDSNIYRYSLNNPANLIDPSGTAPPPGYPNEAVESYNAISYMFYYSAGPNGPNTTNWTQAQFDYYWQSVQNWGLLSAWNKLQIEHHQAEVDQIFTENEFKVRNYELQWLNEDIIAHKQGGAAVEAKRAELERLIQRLQERIESAKALLRNIEQRKDAFRKELTQFNARYKGWHHFAAYYPPGCAPFPAPANNNNSSPQPIERLKNPNPSNYTPPVSIPPPPLPGTPPSSPH